jgi:hypothetical protein
MTESDRQRIYPDIVGNPAGVAYAAVRRDFVDATQAWAQRGELGLKGFHQAAFQEHGIGIDFDDDFRRSARLQDGKKKVAKRFSNSIVSLRDGVAAEMNGLAFRPLFQSLPGAIGRSVSADPKSNIRIKVENALQSIDGHFGFTWSHDHSKSNLAIETCSHNGR